MADITEYFSGQGRVMIGPRHADGSRGPARWIYDASQLEMKMSAEVEEKNESWSGARGLAATMASKKTLDVDLTLGQLNTDIVALATSGQRTEVSGGSVTDEVIGDVKPGEVFALDHVLVSALVIKDGSGNLTANTDYTVNTATGIVTFLTAKTGVKADYSYKAYSVATLLDGASKDWYVLFDGLNTVDGAQLKVRAEIHRVSFAPAQSMGLIQESFNDLQMTGKAKIDPVRQGDAKWGGFARVILVDGTP